MPKNSASPEDLEIGTRTYDWCVKAFRTTKKLLKLNIKLHLEEVDELNPVETGDIFLFNHFARFETFIPQYLIHEETGAYCRSVASSEFFEGDERFSQFLYSVGVVPNDLPNLFPFLAQEILHGKKLVVFPEGGMVKDKRVISQDGQFSIYSRTARERRKHHRGAAVIALALDAFKTALLRDYSKGKYDRIENWAEQLKFDTTEHLMLKAVKPTVVVPSHITFYPIRVNDNILTQAAGLFGKSFNKRFVEELIIEGNLLFKHTDMDIRFAKPLVAGNYWKWWEKLLLPNVVHSFDSLHELFNLKADKGHLGGRLHSLGMQAKSSLMRDDYMRNMYNAVTINLSHIASYLILFLYQQGIRNLRCIRFHKMLYLAIKKLQESDHELHRSLLNPEEYGVIVNQTTSRLEQFLRTVKTMDLIRVENDHYVLEEKLIADFEIDEIRTENLISVYANEVAPLARVTAVIESAVVGIKDLHPKKFAQLRFHDQLLALEWDREKFDRPRYEEINSQQTATSDPNWFFFESSQPDATAVLLIHGMLAGPEEVRGLGERLYAEGHHVLGVRIKGHGTSPWDLRSRNWQDWLASVSRGYNILKAYSQSIHIVGFSTGGLLALLQGSNPQLSKIKTVSCISAPVNFKNKTLKFVPLVHHANKMVRWVASEGLVPFRPNTPEHPLINYQHVPIRALYQLQQLVDHVLGKSIKINAKVYFYQGNHDPVVEPESVEKLNQHVDAEQKSITYIESDRHGILYENIQDIQSKICATIN